MQPNDLLRLPADDAFTRVVRTTGAGQPLSDRSVLDLLTAEHRPNFIYRGQIARHFRPWPAESRPDIAANEYMLDSLIPSDYRGVEDHVRGGKKSDPDVTLAYGNEAVWARFALILTGINILDAHASAISTWFHSLPDNGKNNYLLSLGQHVGLPTENMDLSRSHEVAWWFATHSWNGVYQSGEGIIYRVDQIALETAIGKLNRQQGDVRAELIEIGSGTHEVPDVLTPRPVAQCGLTLAGGEVGEVLLELIAVDGITAFIFHRDHSAHPVSTVAIKPPHDPLVNFINQARNGVWDVEWQTVLRTYLIHKGVTTVPNIGAPRFRAAIFDGYAGVLAMRPVP